MTTALVVLCYVTIALPFVAYPLLLALRATLFPEPIRRGKETPGVDLIIAAHNEAASIEARLENALSLDYPRDQLNIFVASDGSTDRTVEIARTFSGRGVHVLDLPRGGKAQALIAAIGTSSSDILAFSDANSDWATDALRQLVAPFSDERVGGVAGDQRYIRPASSEQGQALGERGYWSFDRLLKQWQSQAGNAISATGAIYAIRRECFEPPPPDATDDFMISTGVIAQGRRLVFATEAAAYEPPADEDAGEFRRKVRIITRGLRAVIYRRALLNPSRTGLYAIELFIHKLWRRLTWIPLLGLVLVFPFTAGGLSTWAAGIATFFVSLGGLAHFLPKLRRFRIVAVSYYIVMVNSACAWATFNTLRGNRVARWDTERVDSQTSEAGT